MSSPLWPRRTELSGIMARRVSEIDVKLLLFAIQRTAGFETLLSRRFSGATLQDRAPAAAEPPPPPPPREVSTGRRRRPERSVQTAELPPREVSHSQLPIASFRGDKHSCFYTKVYLK